MVDKDAYEVCTNPDGNYNVVVYVTGGGTTDSRTFVWTIADTRVDMTPNGMAVLQPIQTVTGVQYQARINLPIDVNIVGTSQDVTFTLTGGGDGNLVAPGSLRPYTATATWSVLLYGGTGTLTVIPLSPSQAVNDVTISASINSAQVNSVQVTIASVDLQQDVRNADTPSGMADRIPPRVATPFQVYVSPNLAGSGQSVALEAVGPSNGSGGTVTGLPSTVTSNTTIQLAGGTQSDGGNLVINAKVGGQIVASTQSFYVAAIPIGIVMGDTTRLEGIEGPAGTFTWAARYAITVESDSGVSDDLDKIQIAERLVVQGTSTGIFAGSAPAAAPATSATTPNLSDTNGVRGAADNLNDAIQSLRAAILDAGNGTQSIDQYFVYTDGRTGSGTLLLPSSGYHLDYAAERDSGGAFYVRVTRTSSANNGVSGGTVDDDSTQDLLVSPN
jgi:hypothetical protein